MLNLNNNIMELEEIIKSLPDAYDAELEKDLVAKLDSMDLASLTSELAELLAFSLSEGYNNLAKTILEKNYSGKRIELERINQSIIEQSHEDYSILHFAAQFGNKEMIEYFLENGIKISLDKDSLSPLHVLTFCKKLPKQDLVDVIKLFAVNSPGIINQRDAFYLTPLHYAAHNDNKAALEALVQCGAKA